MVSKRGKKNIKKYLITSAQASYHVNKDGDELPYGVPRGRKWAPKARPHEEFLKGLETYAKENDAELMILPIAGKNTIENILHEDLKDREDIFRGTQFNLNKNLQIRDLVVPPQNVDPTTGKSGFASKYGSSLIFPHSKQRFLPVPIFNSDIPRYLYTTGAVTLPNYNIANHRGDTAARNHVFGALVVEVIDDTFYNLRNIKAMKNGKFMDLGKKYEGDKIPKQEGVDSLVLGDIHWGDHDEKAIKANYEMIEYFKPERIFLHDFFNGHSINHHEKENYLKRTREYQRNRLGLEDEFKIDYQELKRLSQIAGKKSKIYVISANHHDFLPRYINEGAWMNRDLWNAEIGAYLFSKGTGLKSNENKIDDSAFLIKEGLERHGKLPSNIKFLKVNDNLRRHGYQLASHGDKGRNGSRGGSAKSRFVTFGGKSITGHSHTMEIYGDTYIVGTSSKLDLPYTAGYGSASIGANAVLYKSGAVQMIPIIKGRWKA